MALGGRLFTTADRRSARYVPSSEAATDRDTSPLTKLREVRMAETIQ